MLNDSPCLNNEHLDHANEINIIENHSQHNKTCTNLKFLSLNVCGLKSKQIVPDLCSFIDNYDIVGFQETKMDSLDTVNLDNLIFIINIEQIYPKENQVA